MGSLQAAAFAEAVGDGDISLESALSWHLRANHYPPVPETMVPVCIAAIDAANEGDWDRSIDLPEGVSYRDQTTAPARAIIEGHHLDSFLDFDAWDD